MNLKFIPIVFVFLTFCTPKNKETHYFILGEQFNRIESAEFICYTHIYKSYQIEPDSIKIPLMLTYWKREDIEFVKPISFLDSIDLYEKNWFQDSTKVLEFWGSKQHLKGDPLNIFVGEINNKGDSIHFRKVNRSFVGWR